MITPALHLEYAQGYLELGLFADARRELGLINPADRTLPTIRVFEVDLAMAEQAWRRVLKLAPLATEAAPQIESPWIAWAYALRELQQIEKARVVLSEGEAVIAKPSVLVDYNLACYACLLGDETDARTRLARVFKREPSWKEEAKNDPDLAALYPKPSKTKTRGTS